MYIPTITSWLHSQWQSYIATKIALWVWPSQQFSSRCRTSNKNNTEYRTSVQNYFVTPKQRNSEQKQNSETIFFTVTEVILYDIQVYWNQKFETIIQFDFGHFLYNNWCYPNCKHCITSYSDFKTITVIVPLQKFKQ